MKLINEILAANLGVQSAYSQEKDAFVSRKLDFSIEINDGEKLVNIEIPEILRPNSNVGFTKNGMRFGEYKPCKKICGCFFGKYERENSGKYN